MSSSQIFRRATILPPPSRSRSSTPANTVLAASATFLLARWAFLPGFVKDAKNFPLIINARAEGIAAKPSFRAALKRRRCLVIADGFYEWRKISERGPKQPYLIRRIDREPMGFAGLYETYMDPTGGEIDTACIITTHANGLMSHVHDRMPVILAQQDFSPWLDCDEVEVCALRRC